MKLNLTAQILVGTLVLLASIPIAANAQTEESTDTEESTAADGSFVCATGDGDTPVTAFQIGEEKPAPLIIWKSKFFGTKYNPKQRCNIVSQKLNNAFIASGRDLGKLYLTHGKVNRQTVICYVESETGKCTSKNMLFTLSPKNSKNPQGVLEQIEQYKMGDATIAPVEEGSRQKYLNLSFLKRK